VDRAGRAADGGGVQVSDNGGAEPRVFARGNAEFTRVGIETEVRIPWQTYVLTACTLMIVDGCLWSIGWLIWFRARLKAVSFGRWASHEWGRWAGYNWPWVLITLILCWMLAAVPYLYRLLTEQVIKQGPQYTPYPAELGRWRPFRPQPLPYEPEEMEKSAETVDVNLWDRIAKGRKRRRTMPDFLVSAQARQFYRAVTADPAVATFSERSAAHFDISRHDFRKHIRDALVERKLATWKNERHPNLGVNLTDDAKRTMEILGRTPPPRRSA
jgi:hypothetical protein